MWHHLSLGCPWWLSGKESACQCRSHGFDPWVGKIPWIRKWQPTSAFLPGKSHGQRSLVSYSPWDCKRVGQDGLNNSHRHLWGASRPQHSNSAPIPVNVVQCGPSPKWGTFKPHWLQWGDRAPSLVPTQDTHCRRSFSPLPGNWLWAGHLNTLHLHLLGLTVWMMPVITAIN